MTYPLHDLPACPVTGKISWRNRAKARKALRKPMNAGRSAKAAYKCDSCPYWHLTSHPHRSKR